MPTSYRIADINVNGIKDKIINIVVRTFCLLLSNSFNPLVCIAMYAKRTEIDVVTIYTKLHPPATIFYNGIYKQFPLRINTFR